jgi:hypothetical protein
MDITLSKIVGTCCFFNWQGHRSAMTGRANGIAIVFIRWRQKSECPFREEKGIPVLGDH